MEAVNLTLDCSWWDEQLQHDIPSDCINVKIWAKDKGSNCRAFDLNCHTPQELWDYIHALVANKERVLKEKFNYETPKDSRCLPTDLMDLFQ